MKSIRKQSGLAWFGIFGVIAALLAVGVVMYITTLGGKSDPTSDIVEAINPDSVKDTPEDGDNCNNPRPDVLC